MTRANPYASMALEDLKALRARAQRDAHYGARNTYSRGLATVRSIDHELRRRAEAEALSALIGVQG